MKTNSFPAVLLAGPPHSGKSVLSYLLTQHLREMKVAHYLLRAVPDGEGDWFHAGGADIVQTIRVQHKRGFSASFVSHMRKAIEERWLPLLVDIGGRPQGDQFDLIGACSHSVLLYREQAERDEWRGYLARAGLQPVAELQSVLDTQDQIAQLRPILAGVISGLERDQDKRREGAAFGALLDRVSGICHYEAAELERIHASRANFTFLSEQELAKQLGFPADQKVIWSPEHLVEVARLVPAGKSFALYGRGPVWLAAMLAARVWPAPFSVFDVRLGWFTLPDVTANEAGNLLVAYDPFAEDGLWANFALPQDGILQPATLTITPPPENKGVVLSGKLPRWAFASLARFLVRKQPWVAVDDPAYKRAIVIFSRSAEHPLGSVLSRL